MATSTSLGISDRLTNIIGVPLPNFVREQLKLRSQKLGGDYDRKNKDLSYLGNKGGFIRVISSVNTTLKEDMDYFRQIAEGAINLQDMQSLAKQYILFGGTSKYVEREDGFDYALRSGYGPDNAYGMLGNNEIRDFGYKPMPGITSAKITTQGKLGSVRSAEIQFKCWTKQQLDIIDLLYFKLGFSMFIEWGNTTFFRTDAARPEAELDSGENYSIDVFKGEQDVTTINRQIYKNIVDSQGNYDAMLGIVTNFNFNFSTDGGYECTLKVMSLGILADSMKVNKIQELPTVLKDEISQAFNSINELIKISERNRKAAEQAASTAALQAQIDALKAQQTALSGTNAVDPSNFPQWVKQVTNSDPNIPLPKGAKPATTIKGSDGSDNYLFVDPNANEIGYGLSKLGKVLLSSKDYEVTIDLANNAKIKDTTTAKNNVGNLQGLGESGYYTGTKSNPQPAGTQTPVDSNNINTITSNFRLLNRVLLNHGYQPGNVGNFNFSDTKGATDRGKIRFDSYVTGDRESFFLTQGVRSNGALETSIFKFDRNVNQYIDQASGYSYDSGKYKYRFVIGDIGRDSNNNDVKLYDLKMVDPNNQNAQVQSDKVQGYLKDLVEGALDKLVSTSTKWQFKKEDSNTFNDNFGIQDYNGNSAVNQLGSIRLLSEVQLDIADIQTAQAGQTNTGPTKKVNFPIWLMINDPGLITSITEQATASAGGVQGGSAQTPQPTQPPAAPPLTVDQVQESEASKYQSAIEIMLRAIQLKQLNLSINSRNVVVNNEGDFQTVKPNKVNLWEDKSFKPYVRALFSKGIFADFYDDLMSGNISIDDPNFLKVAAVYGFNNNLMQDPTNFLNKLRESKAANSSSDNLEDALKVDYKQLMFSYLIPYKVNTSIFENLNFPAYPVYVTMGFFLMALNHMCVLYNQQDDQGDDKDNKAAKNVPLVYIDFNNKSNFCLANPSTFSTNPLSFLIPFEGSKESYKEIFGDLADSGSYTITVPPSGSTPAEVENLFNFGELNVDISNIIEPRFRYTNFSNVANEKEQAYRGNIMNVLVNIEYLLNTISSFTNQDEENSVYLKPLLDKIVSDLNKTLGNVNVFRVAFNDYANTYYISDDQVVPPTRGESYIQANNAMGMDSKGRLTDLPLYGKDSIARQLSIKTEISTRLSNMIAISANGKMNDKYAASTDATTVGYINAGLQDRYKKKVTDVKVSNKNKNETTKRSAIQFNQTVKYIYTNNLITVDRISHATNFYIERMNKLKSLQAPTRASAMIPVSLNFTVDGVSGLAMGHSFTVADEILPYSYSGRPLTVKSAQTGVEPIPKTVGFIIIGVDHELANNQWTTNVRSNMYFLKSNDLFATVDVQKNPIQDISTFAPVQATNTGDVNLQGDEELYWYANFIHNQGNCGAASILDAAAKGITIMDSRRNPGYTNPICAKNSGTDSIQYNMFGKTDGYPSSAGNVGSNFQSVVSAAGGNINPLYTPANFILYKKAQFREKYDTANDPNKNRQYGAIFQYFDDACKQYGVPVDYVKYVAYSESSFNPNSGNSVYKGLFALSQQEFSKYVPGGNIFNPKDNTTAGVQILKQRLADARRLRQWYEGGRVGKP